MLIFDQIHVLNKIWCEAAVLWVVKLCWNGGIVLVQTRKVILELRLYGHVVITSTVTTSLGHIPVKHLILLIYGCSMRTHLIGDQIWLKLRCDRWYPTDIRGIIGIDKLIYNDVIVLCLERLHILRNRRLLLWDIRIYCWSLRYGIRLFVISATSIPHKLIEIF